MILLNYGLILVLLRLSDLRSEMMRITITFNVEYPLHVCDQVLYICLGAGLIYRRRIYNLQF